MIIVDDLKHEPSATLIRYLSFSKCIAKSILNVFPKHFGRAREKVSHVAASGIYFGTFGLVDLGTFGLSDFGTFELLDFGTLGFGDFGTLGLWTLGLLDLGTF